MPTETEQQQALKILKERFNERLHAPEVAATLEPRRGQSLMNAIAYRINAKFPGQSVTEKTVQNWLEGKDLPRSKEVFNAFMDLLKLQYTEAQLHEGRLLPPMARKAEIRILLTQAWHTALPAFENVAVEEPDATKPAPQKMRQRWQADKQGQLSYGERPELDALMINRPGNEPYNGKPYASFSPAEWQKIGSSTHSFREYLNIKALQLNLSWTDIARLANRGFTEGITVEPTDIANYARMSGRLPGPEKLERLVSAFNPQTGEKLLGLAIQNRLIIIAHAPHMQAIGRQLSELPRAYWQAAIDHVLMQHQQWQKKYADTFWAKDILPIETQADYFKAMRNLLGIAADEFKKLVPGGSNVSLLEDANFADQQLRLRSDAIDFYDARQEAILQKHPNAFRFFSREVFENPISPIYLPPRRTTTPSFTPGKYPELDRLMVNRPGVAPYNGMAYELFGPEQWQDMRKRTHSLREWLIVFRQIHDLTPSDVCDLTGIPNGSYSHFEMGASLPSLENLQKLKHLFDRYDPKAAREFDNLIIFDRLTLLRNAKDIEKIGNEQTQEMPLQYWKAVVDERRLPKKEWQEKYGKEIWAGLIFPMTDLSDYFTAMRRLVNKTAYDVAGDMGVGAAYVMASERRHYQYPQSILNPKLISHYEKELKAAGLGEYFDQRFFDRQSSLYLPSHGDAEGNPIVQDERRQAAKPIPGLEPSFLDRLKRDGVQAIPPSTEGHTPITAQPTTEPTVKPGEAVEPAKTPTRTGPRPLPPRRPPGRP